VGFVRAVFRRITCKPSSVSVAHDYSKNVAILAHAIVAKERVGGNQVSKFLGTVAVRVGSFFAFLSAMPVLHFGALANLAFWMLRHVRQIMILWHIRRYSGAAFANAHIRGVNIIYRIIRRGFSLRRWD
jgi:hypothetical protein